MSDKSKKPEEKKHELREISDEELEIILAEHEKWLETRGKEGKRADLSRANLAYNFLEGANLQQANLIMADLQGADLSGANLQEADLYQANLPEADLYQANLQMAKLYDAELEGAWLEQADLSDATLYSAKLQKAWLHKAILVDAQLDRANLREAIIAYANVGKARLEGTDLGDADLTGIKGLNIAILKYCNMKGAIGLKGDEFAGADVTGAKLPQDIAKWKVLEVVAETSKNARKIFLAMLLACVYSWLTIGSTTDVNLLTNSASSPLPIIGTAIPIAWFYFAAPLLLLGLYFYQHFYLQRLWENLAGLPAKFEDGKRLDQRAYPWLLNGLVRRHFDKLRGERTPLQRLEEWVTIFLAWWVVPLTLLWFWARYLPRHDWGGTGLQVGLAAAAIAAGFAFYTTHARTLRGEARLKLTWKTAWKDTRIWRTLGAVALGAGLVGLSHGSINGVRPMPEEEADLSRMSKRVPWLFEQFGYDVFADLREAIVSARPANYWLLDPNLRDSSVTGVNLREVDLRQADLGRAFLAKADLRGADLRWAWANGTNLSGARLWGAQLDSAELSYANLRGADLQFVDLKGTNLFGADLSGADLEGAWAVGANLREARLEGARLNSAGLAEANLRGADLSGANLRGTKLVWTNLEGADLGGADLSKADLRKADLAGADLQGAQLGDADLSGAVLFDSSFDPPLSVRGLTQEQLDEACGDSLTQLPPGLTIKPCPCEDSTGTATDSGP